jgi:hypothetical protein
MDVEVRNDRLDGNTVVTLQGPIDVDAALQLDALFSELVGQLAIRIVVDLAAVTVCEPAGLLSCRRRECLPETGWLPSPRSTDTGRGANTDHGRKSGPDSALPDDRRRLCR